MGERQFNFVSGVETAVLPTAGTPTVDTDLVTKAYGDANYLGGGGGSSVVWNDNGPNAPAKEWELNQEVFMFDNLAGLEVYTAIRVPQGYTAGNQIKLFISSYSPSSSLTQLIAAESALLTPGTTAFNGTFSSYTNKHLSTNAAITNDAANELTTHEIDLTDGSGEINSVALAAGDLLVVRLVRSIAGDTDTAAVRVLISGSEVTFS